VCRPRTSTPLVEKLKTQKGIMIDQQVIPGANHSSTGKLQPLMETVTGYSTCGSPTSLACRNNVSPCSPD